jgi:uncharacterized protein (DUF2147 family)
MANSPCGLILLALRLLYKLQGYNSSGRRSNSTFTRIQVKVRVLFCAQSAFRTHVILFLATLEPQHHIRSHPLSFQVTHVASFMMQSAKSKAHAKSATQGNEKEKSGIVTSLRALIKGAKGTKANRAKVVEQDHKGNKPLHEQQGSKVASGFVVSPPEPAEPASSGPPQPSPTLTEEGAHSASQRTETVVGENRVDENINNSRPSPAETNTMSGDNLVGQLTSLDHIASMTRVEALAIDAAGVGQNQLDDTPLEKTDTTQSTTSGDNTTLTAVLGSPTTTSQVTLQPLPSSELGKTTQRRRAAKAFQTAVKELQSIINALAKDDPKLKKIASDIQKLDEPDMNAEEIWSTIDSLMDNQAEMGDEDASAKDVVKKWFQASVPIAKVCLDITKVCTKVTLTYWLRTGPQVHSKRYCPVFRSCYRYLEFVKFS